MVRLSVIFGFVLVSANVIQGIYRESTEKTIPVVDEGCVTSEFGCCFDNETAASGPNREGCPCSVSEFGCCPDGLTAASGNQMEGCMMSCMSTYGCCPDNETPAHGPDSEGCCLLHEFGCCPDNYTPAKGPGHEGCGCEYASFGCCPDNITIARGRNMEGCGCEHSRYGCCPDRHTEAQGTEFQGCECHTYQFGCCLDGVTIASGPGLEGCRCERSKYGCCGDETTSAKGPNMAGCDCSNSKYGCCPDGITEAEGDNFQNCSNVPVNKQAACALDNDKGPCHNYTKVWYYNMYYGLCSQFWYGGCEGNSNRFVTKRKCRDVCVQPSPKDSCNLPKVKAICNQHQVRWYYNSERKQCSQFVYGGCLGNFNNFYTKEICQEHCEPEKTEDQCNLDLERGPCAGNFTRWGFSAERRRCEQFVWGGCGGNHNRYVSEAACQMQCTPHGKPQRACSLPQDAGNCSEKHPVWSFNQTENRCVPFYYSGCGGNDNRFNTEQSCDGSCPSAYVQDICTLPSTMGLCDSHPDMQKWFYDTTIKRCRRFHYGGCGGNENSFWSESECENRCSEQPFTSTTVEPETFQPQTEPAVIGEKSGSTDSTTAESSTNYSIESSTTEFDETDTTRYTEFTEIRDSSMYPDFWLGETENEFTTTETTESDISSTTESTTDNGASIITEDSESSGHLDTSSSEGSTDSTTAESSTNYSIESSTTEFDETDTTRYTEFTEIRDSSMSPDFWLGETENEFTTTETTESDISSTTESTTDNGASIITEDSESSGHLDTSSSEGSTDSTTAESSTNYSIESSTTEFDETDTTRYTEFTEIRDSSMSPDFWWGETENEFTTTETTESDISSTTESTTDNGASIITEDSESSGHLDTSSSEGSTDSTTAESSTNYSIESSTTEFDETDTTRYTEFTEIRDSSMYPGSIVSTTADRSINYSIVAITTESDKRGITRYTGTTEIRESSNSPVPVTAHIVSERTWLAPGSELNLVCEVDGYPLPEVYWFKDFALISSDDRITVAETHLTVSRVNTNDTGVYSCHAFNAINSQYSSVQINVERMLILPACEDYPYISNCNLIVRSKFCYIKFFSNFCCKSCVEAGQLDVRNLQLHAGHTLHRKYRK